MSNNAEKVQLEAAIVKLEHDKEMVLKIAAAYEHKLTEKNSTISQLQEQNKLLADTVESIVSSRSWRLTKPLRDTALKIRRLLKQR